VVSTASSTAGLRALPCGTECACVVRFQEAAGPHAARVIAWHGDQRPGECCSMRCIDADASLMEPSPDGARAITV